MTAFQSQNNEFYTLRFLFRKDEDFLSIIGYNLLYVPQRFSPSGHNLQDVKLTQQTDGNYEVAL